VGRPNTTAVALNLTPSPSYATRKPGVYTKKAINISRPIPL
jgi:hypothetical protein